VRRTGRAEEPFAVEWGESLIAKSTSTSSVASIANTMETYWLGTVSVPGEKPSPRELEALEEVLRRMKCIPVFLEADMARKAYHGYCKQVRRWVEVEVVVEAVVVVIGTATVRQCDSATVRQ
jgi:trehalose-6-phosphate synthase